MISVIIPTYNRANTILNSVYSILSQTYSDIECIVVDDGSVDNTTDIINHIKDTRLRYYKIENNSGACTARNKGIELARGDYIAFQDSDDIWKDNKLEVQLKALCASKADVCFCKMQRHSIIGNKIEYTDARLSEGIIPYETLYKSSIVSTQTILAHKYVFEKVKFDKHVKKAQDYEWTIRAGCEYKFFFVNQALVDQYIQADSISANAERNYLVGLNTFQYFYDKFKGKYKLYPGLEVVLLKLIARYKVLSGENAAEEYKTLYNLTGDKKEYIEYIVEKVGPGILKRFFMFRRKNSRDFFLDA